MRPEACGPWFWVGSAIGLISVVTTLSVYSGGPLCLSRKCTSSPLLMSFSSHGTTILDTLSWTGTGGRQSTYSIYRQSTPLLSSSACDCKTYRRSHASDSSWLLVFALQHLVARTSLTVEQLVRVLRVYALKVTSLVIHTFFLWSKPSRLAFQMLHDLCWKIFQQWIWELSPPKISIGLIIPLPYKQPQPSHSFGLSQTRYTIPLVHAFYIIEEED